MKLPAEVEVLAKKVEPLFGRIVIWPCDIQFTDKESLLLRPDISDDAPETGIIVAADSDTLKVGDAVLFGRYSGYGIADNTLVTCRAEDVFMRLHGVKLQPRGRDTHPIHMESSGRILEG